MSKTVNLEASSSTVGQKLAHDEDATDKSLEEPGRAAAKVLRLEIVAIGSPTNALMRFWIESAISLDIWATSKAIYFFTVQELEDL